MTLLDWGNLERGKKKNTLEEFKDKNKRGGARWWCENVTLCSTRHITTVREVPTCKRHTNHSRKNVKHLYVFVLVHCGSNASRVSPTVPLIVISQNSYLFKRLSFIRFLYCFVVAVPVSGEPKGLPKRKMAPTVATQTIMCGLINPIASLALFLSLSIEKI